MNFIVKVRKEDEGIFMDLFRANRRLFKDVKKRMIDGTVEFQCIPLTVLLMNVIVTILKQEKDMGTEFEVHLDLD